MYQISMSIGSDYVNWFYAVERGLKRRLSPYGVMVTRGEKNRLYIAVACENHHKKSVNNILFDTLSDIYCYQAKRHYFKENLVLPLLNEEKYNILLTALVEFDASSDRELILHLINLENGLNIDGIYNFKLGQVKSRWRDIGQLTRDNSAYLADNDIFLELIRYLFSAITPKTDTVLLDYDGDRYSIFDTKGQELIKEAFSEEELLCALISTAPIGLEFSGARFDSGVRGKISAIFGQVGV